MEGKIMISATSSAFSLLIFVLYIVGCFKTVGYSCIMFDVSSGNLSRGGMAGFKCQVAFTPPREMLWLPIGGCPPFPINRLDVLDVSPVNRLYVSDICPRRPNVAGCLIHQSAVSNGGDRCPKHRETPTFAVVPSRLRQKNLQVVPLFPVDVVGRKTFREQRNPQSLNQNCINQASGFNRFNKHNLLKRISK
jgi:hypothetical protein